MKFRVLYKFGSTWKIQLTQPIRIHVQLSLSGGLTLEEYLLSHRKSSILQTYPSTVTQDGCYFILIEQFSGHVLGFCQLVLYRQVSIIDCFQLPLSPKEEWPTTFFAYRMSDHQ